MGHYNINYYCKYNNISIEDFGEKLDFSIWEYIQGNNCMVIGDSSVPNRHFVFFKPEKNMNKNLVVFNKSNPAYILDEHATDKKDINIMKRAIQTYEEIIKLDHFDSNHKPAIELTLTNDKTYFLQYHRIRDFVERTHVIERPPHKDEVVVPFSRGHTSKDGEYFDVLLFHSRRAFFEEEKATSSFSDYASSIMIRKRELYLKICDSVYEGFEGEFTHGAVEELVKPKITVFYEPNKFASIKELEGIKQLRGSPDKNWYPRYEWDSYYGHKQKQISGSNREPIRIKVMLIADGEKAYMKRLE